MERDRRIACVGVDFLPGSLHCGPQTARAFGRDDRLLDGGRAVLKIGLAKRTQEV